MKIPNNNYQAFSMIDFENDIINRSDILQYLKIRELVEEGNDNSLTIKEDNYRNYLLQEIASIRDFYNHILQVTNNTGIWDLLKGLKRIMSSSLHGLKIDKLQAFINKFPQEFANAVKLGMISEIEYDNSSLYLISPEVWYMITGEIPIQWDSKVIYTTSTYEVFVPYNYNPFKVQVIDYFNGDNGEKENNNLKYNSDYFIISYIGKYDQINNTFFHHIDMLNCLKDACENIHDIYKYELFIDIWY